MIALPQQQPPTSLPDPPLFPKRLQSTISQFELHQQNFKKYQKQINHAFTYPNQYQKRIFEVLLEQQTQQLQHLQRIMPSIDSQNRRPYTKILKHYHQCVQQHQKLIQLLQNPQEFVSLIKSSPQIDPELLQQYLQTLKFPHIFRGTLGLIGAFLIHLIIGASSRWNMLNVYATSYYRIIHNPQLSVTFNIFGTPLALFFMGIGIRLGIKFNKIVGTFYCCIISMTTASAMVFVSSYMTHFALFMLFAFVLYPLISTLSFNNVMNQCYKYLPKHRLLINAVILSGSAFGHIFFGYLNDHCMNPFDLQPIGRYYSAQLQHIALAFPQCMRQQSYLTILIGILAVALMFPMLIFNNSLSSIQRRTNKTRLQYSLACPSQTHALLSPVFYLMIILLILSTCGCFFMSTNFKNQINQYQHDSKILASVMFAFNLSNSASRIMWTIGFGRIGFKYCVLTICTLNIIVLLTISEVLNKTHIYLLYYAISGACLGGAMVIFINSAMLIFGQEVGEQMPGYIWAGSALSCFLQYVFLNLYDVQEHGYAPIRLGLASFNVLGIGVIVWTRFQGAWGNPMQGLEFKCYQ